MIRFHHPISGVRSAWSVAFARSFVVSMVLLALVSTTPALHAAGCSDDVFVSDTVPADGVTNFANIMDAYAAVCAGGTVHVAAGTYLGSIDISDLNAKDGVTIDGAGATTIIDGGVHTTNSVAISGMTFSNMTILHSDGTAGEGLIRMDNGGSISDLTLDGVVLDGQGIVGVHGILGQGLIGTVTVTGSTLENIANWAVFDSDSGGGIGDDGLTGFVFTNNVVRNNDGGIALRGADLGSAVPTTSTVVTGNSFSNMNTSLHAGPCSYPANQCGWAGVEVTRVWGLATVTDNTFDNLQLGAFGEGEGLQAWMITDLIVTGNTFNHCDSGIEIAYQDTHPVTASIHDNSFSNLATRAIGVWDAGLFLNTPSTTAGIDASCNYWGNDNGPLVAGQNDHTGNGETYGDVLEGTMVYALWRTGSIAGRCTGGDCDGNTIHDYEDILAGASDCDGDQDLDSCETDTDSDGTIDDCDADDDGDSFPDADEEICGSDPLNASSTPADFDNDADGLCDAIDDDDDNDGCLDIEDEAPFESDHDFDNDGVPDDCDDDDDNDGSLDVDDSDDNNEFVCSDDDGDTCDDCSNGFYNTLDDGTDTDGDGLCDAGDDDVDGDNILNVCDTDQTPGVDCNNNGSLDSCDLAAGTSTDCNRNNIPDDCETDTDLDGTIDDCDDDIDGDGILNGCDTDQTPGKDCNNNGSLDSCDLSSGSSLDCNTNLIPDDCEVDCNNNGTPDDCDIAAGFPDCDGNLIPDSCDFASGTVDCNGNNFIDSCEINEGITPDCNSNGTPDDCDITAGTSLDCNSNGVPDECETCDTDTYVGFAVADGVDNFATIMEAYAAVCAGGTVHVAAGTHTESIAISDANAKDGITIDG
ncbi:MAG: hypothetical protein VX764_06655, partial [Planctomycetota bacterium]|nr:hypothetical protein [Planctomycetota bacterium]